MYHKSPRLSIHWKLTCCYALRPENYYSVHTDVAFVCYNGATNWMEESNMSFMNRIKAGLYRFMSGRYGADQLSMTALWTAIILSVLGSLTGLSFLGLLSTALFVWTLFRMLSRNLVRRRLENDKYQRLIAPVSTWFHQARTRFKLRKQYLYFRCPQCKSMLKLPRKVGEVTMTCGKCNHQFKKKA